HQNVEQVADPIYVCVLFFQAEDGRRDPKRGLVGWEMGIRDGVSPPQGFVFQRVYTDDRSIDQAMAVENNDLVTVPRGYHPVSVPYGYESYYLNVMAGPTRAWQFNNDPQHSWLLDL
ncbi:5-deoxy-glucuronate isomerase, partial [Pseudomonas syringae]|uniref:5-deoxy-glucuronate isomerase n=1 Tax=Pseudomonas syringae TaxID=317 RepID=UPI001F15CD53